MGNALILYNDVIQGMALTASSAAVDDLGQQLGPANLQRQDLGSLWRATGKASEFVRGVASEPVAADTFFLIGHNMSARAEYELTLYADAEFSEVAHADSGLVWKSVFGIGEAPMAESTIGGLPIRTSLDDEPARRLIRLPEEIVFRTFELRFRDGANPKSYVELARLMAGIGWRPEFNFELGSEFAIGSDDEVAQLGRGAVWVRRGRSWGEHAVTFADLTRTEADTFIFDFMRRVRLSKPFLFAPYPDASMEEWRTTLYCLLTAPPRRVKRDQHTYAVTLHMREIVG